jgi:serine/threonine protein kinase
LRHPNLLEIFDSGEMAADSGTWVYLVTAKPDENLAGVLRERALDATETRQMLDSVLAALSFLHERGYVHGGIRPTEVLACGDQVKLSTHDIRRHPAEGTAEGASFYRAPEMASGSFGPPVDAWSAAVLTLECLTRSPYRSEIDRVGSPFREIVEGGLEPDPEKRWNVDLMRETLAGRGPVATPPPVAEVSDPHRHYRRFAGIAVGGALAAAAICVLLIRSAHQAPAPAPVTIQASAHARVAQTHTPVPVIKPLAPGATQPGWAVVSAAYRRAEDAEKRATEIRRGHSRLNPSVMHDGNRFLVVFGSGMTEAQARRELDRARRSGAPRDSYITKFR